MASTTKGGMFSLLWSPSSREPVVFARFGFGVASGVGRMRVPSRSREEVESEESSWVVWWDRLPRTEPGFLRGGLIVGGGEEWGDVSTREAAVSTRGGESGDVLSWMGERRAQARVRSAYDGGDTLSNSAQSTRRVPLPAHVTDASRDSLRKLPLSLGRM